MALLPRIRALALALVLSNATAAMAGGFVDVLDSPAPMSPIAARAALQSVVPAGDRLVAVGQRGVVLVSNDAGATWKQSPAPVASDLTSVFFVDEAHGWAVGHDGVILHSGDGGATWQVQFTGRQANDLLLAAMERRAAAEPSSEEANKLLDEAKRYKAQGADKPFLDVWFADANNGYAVGAYNLIFHTSDGGATWESWFDRVDNPRYFNLYAIRCAAGELFVAGEGGLVLKLDAAAQRFRAVKIPYEGSLFGLVDGGARAVVFGLRGNVYGSDDGGTTWEKIDAGLPASVVAAARLRDGGLLVADAGGRIAASADGGHTFAPLALEKSAPLFGLADAGDGRLALVGPRGALVTRAAPR